MRTFIDRMGGSTSANIVSGSTHRVRYVGGSSSANIVSGSTHCVRYVEEEGIVGSDRGAGKPREVLLGEEG